MKKNIAIIVLAVLLSNTIKAQEAVVSAQAVINTDGSRQMNVTDAAGKTTTLSAGSDAALKEKYYDLVKKQTATNAAPIAEQKIQIVAHRAVIGLNGKQQIIVTFASGKEKAIDAVEGQSIQETYLAYLKKEGLNCGCSPVSTIGTSDGATHTATKNPNTTNQ